MNNWSVYIVQCKDGTYYTGITTDIDARIKVHNSGLGAKYTRGRGPVKLVWSEGLLTRGEALRRECEIKKMSRAEKQQLIKN
jgi:putative endonuclease